MLIAVDKNYCNNKRVDLLFWPTLYVGVGCCVMQVVVVQQMLVICRPVEVACLVFEAWDQLESVVVAGVVFPSLANHTSLSTPVHSVGYVD